MTPPRLSLALTRPLALVDLETTGTSTQNDRIVEITVVVLRPEGGEPDIRTRRLNPGIPIPAEASAIHGITDADVADCPPFNRVAIALHELLDPCDLAGFGLRRFDFPLLRAEFRRVGLDLSHRGRALLDAQAIFHRQEPRDLTAAVRFFCGRELEGAHSSEADVIATGDVLFAQVDRYGLPSTPEALSAWIDETHPYVSELEKWFDTSIGDDPAFWRFRRGKHDGKSLREVSLHHGDYFHWMAYKAEDMDPEVRAIALDGIAGRYAA